MDGKVEYPPIALGTAQLGMPYGIGAAQHGVAEDAAISILEAAWAQGIHCFDTARAYGLAEERIGQWLKKCAPKPQPVIVSKFPAILTGMAPTEIERALVTSRAALGVEKIHVYLAHQGTDLLRPGAVARLRDYVAKGKIECFGASVYDADDARLLLKIPDLAALQVPINIANTSLADSGLLNEAAVRNVRIFARSVFLQGLLLADAAALTGLFSRASPILGRLESLAREAKTTRTALAIAAAREFPGVSTVVIGVDSVTQLEDIVAAFQIKIDHEVIAAALKIARQLPPDLADPRRWKKPTNRADA